MTYHGESLVGIQIASNANNSLFHSERKMAVTLKDGLIHEYLFEGEQQMVTGALERYHISATVDKK